MTPSFEGLGLEPRTVATLVGRGYKAPTPIQAALIPVLLTGRDAIGQAPTGTGKTAAFSLPIIERIQSGAGHVQALVLAPTRELAIQVADTVYAYGNASGIRVLPVFGGQAYTRQISRLRSGVDIVVGTPGRLLDLCSQGALDLSQVSTVVLDEADEMLSMGFIEDIEALLDQTPAERQTVLMSATMPAAIRKLARKYMRDAESCSVDADREAPVVRQRAYLVNHRDKVAALARIFETEEVSSALVFAKTRAGTEELAAELVARHIPAEALHGSMSQDARTRIVQRLRDGGIRVLVGTDVAARGLDIEGITHVFNFELPADPEVYLHRIGRTARAGRGGDAVTLYAPNETGKLRRVEGFTRQKMELVPLPSTEEVEALRSAKVVERVGVWIRRGRCHIERAAVEQMVAEGIDPLEIAAAALRHARQAEYPHPVEDISAVSDRRPKRTDRRDGGGYGSHERTERRDPRSFTDRSGGFAERSAGFADRSAGFADRSSGFADRSSGSADRSAGSRAVSPRSEGFERESGMVALTLSAGRDRGIRVGQVVSTIARHGGIPAESIGRIWIEDRRTVVHVRQPEVARLLGKSGELRVGPERLQVDLA